MQGLKLHHIRNVLSVGNHGSLRGAARALNIAQPVLTRSIQEVERLLGVALFERTSRGVAPTIAGQAFLRRVAVIQSELDRACHEAAQLAGIDGGKIHFALSTAAHLSLLPRALPGFRKRFPKVTVCITEGLLSRLHQQIEDGSIDFYVGPVLEAELPVELTKELLFENERLVFCRRGHPLAQVRTLAELTDASWLSTSVTSETAAELGPYFADNGLPEPHIALHASSALTMVLAAANSDLLAMLPKQWLEFPSIEQFVSVVPIEKPIAAPAIYLVQRRRLPLTPAAQYFCDLIVKAAGNL